VIKGVPFEPDQLEYRDKIAALQETDAIFSVCFPEHFVRIFTQLKEEAYDGYIVGSSDAAVPYIFNTSHADGAYLAAPIIYNSNYIFARKVKEKYEDRYGRPFDHFAGNGYDVVKILVGLLEEREISRQNLKNQLPHGFMY